MNEEYVSKMLDEMGCDWNRRRKCDSLYIELYNKLKKKSEKEKRELEKQIKQLMDQLDKNNKE